MTTKIKASNIDSSASQLFGMRNRIINGAMMIDQRESATTPVVSSTTSMAYSVDRFACRTSSSTSQITLEQDTSAPEGFIKSLKATVTTTGSPTYSAILQRVEGLNVADFGWGTANAVPATLSFWVRSSVTGQFSVLAYSNGVDRSIAIAYTINSADTWEYKTVTIPAPTTGTFPTTTSYCFAVGFTLGAPNASYVGAGGSWVTGTQRAAVTGSVDLNQTLNATFYITGVQLEVGSVATPFEHRLYGTELALCQRYYEILTTGFVGTITSGQAGGGAVTFAVTKRAVPTMAQVESLNASGFGTGVGNYFVINECGVAVYHTATITGNCSWVDKTSASSEL